MVSVERSVGRLVEGIVASPIEPGDVAGAIQQIRLTILGTPGKAVCCIDATGLTLLPAGVSDTFVELFTRDNPKIECSAFLLAKRASGVGLQLDRMLRQAGHPARRSFDDRDVLVEWLSPSLSVEERVRLKSFLGRRA